MNAVSMDNLNYPRLLRYKLNRADVLYFRCLPGNRAEWLLPIVRSRFSDADVFPPASAASEPAFSRYSDRRVGPGFV